MKVCKDGVESRTSHCVERDISQVEGGEHLVSSWHTILHVHKALNVDMVLYRRLKSEI
jgi:hypothetical protein